MQVFRLQDMEENLTAIQDAAISEPVLIAEDHRPHLVLMSIAEYARLRGRDRRVGGLDDMDGDVVQSIIDLADQPSGGTERDWKVAAGS